MVAEGSGGIFNGLAYHDEDGRLCTGADYILNRLPLAQAEQYLVLFWEAPRGMRNGYHCKRAAGKTQILV